LHERELKALEEKESETPETFMVNSSIGDITTYSKRLTDYVVLDRSGGKDGQKNYIFAG
jgi:hypothetical protein